MARILSIDYGTKRVGLAVTDPLQIIATALTTVPEKDALNYIASYLEMESVERFVVGEPKNWDDTDTHATIPAGKFVEKLQKRFPAIPVSRVDERNTSKMAVQSMVLNGIRKKERQKKENIDMISATIILQDYLQNPTL